MACSVCVELERSLQSALGGVYPSVQGLTEAGSQSRAQQKQERVERIRTLLLQHRTGCREALLRAGKQRPRLTDQQPL